MTPAPKGFTSAGFAAKVRCVTGQTDAEYTIREAAYDLRKLRGKDLIELPARTRRYHVPPQAARTIAALLTLRSRHCPHPRWSPPSRVGPKPANPTGIGRNYEKLRIDMESLFDHLGISTRGQLAATA